MPFPSLYVDNKQPEIAELLANRYDANKTSKDLIDRTLSQLELLPGDQAHLERVKTDVKGTLKDHIEKQDWENSSLVVQDAAQLVETDAGLIASNKSMKNRQAEINAMREAKLNGIPMLDFGKDSRSVHESYYYDEETGAYITNVYEPMMEQQLDYRTRKEAMIGNIPASQKGDWMGVSRSKTNKVANLMVEQYITDTKEGIQEFKKLVEMDLPQSIPLEERAKMAKAQILNDFKEVARQQEFDKVTGTGSGDNGRDPISGMKLGVTTTGGEDTEINTAFDNMSDKVRGIQERQMVINKFLASGKGADGNELSVEENKALQDELTNNDMILDNNLKKVAAQNGIKGERALKKYNNIRDRFSEFGDDGKRLLAATQYLTYLNTKDTDWAQVGYTALAGGAATGVITAGVNVAPGVGQIGYGMAITAGTIGTGIGELFSQWNSDLRGVRDWDRRQEPVLGGWVGDSEREQLAEELWGDEDLGDMKVDHINGLLGTNFNQNDIEELYKMTNAYYTFMTKDEMKENGVQVDRMSGDDLFEKVQDQTFTLNQRRLSFDMTDEGKKLRNATNSFIQSDIPLNNAGLKFDGMVGNQEISKWIEDDIGGASKLTLEGVLLPDVATNTPLRLTFGSTEDATGSVNRSATVSDPNELQPGGWIYDLIQKNYGEGDKVYNEIIRQSYDNMGYENVTMDRYSNDLADKQQIFFGGTDEDKVEYKRLIENDNIMQMLVSPEFVFEHYRNANGVKGINGQTGFIPFIIADNSGRQSFNAAAWQELQNKPEELQALRTNMLETSLKDFAGTSF